MPRYCRGGSFVCAHRILHRMEALVISIWGLCTTEGEFRLQVLRQDFRGVIDPFLSWRERVGHERG
ncbi:hypothetical protein BHM03_00017973 [Ensete ventricosum]|uniref:Uncharacterized protein n=1 Tax=Ensete ventricosum TaxID=4639 RepID=A0A445MF09_ENSVE|nr:hypothetical protein BHM03_00017973 [Ensete ventricosum]